MKIGYAAAAMAALALAAPGLAQGNESDFSTKEIRAVMHGYARCIVAKQGGKASQALIRNLDNSTILRRYPMLIDGDCLTDETRTPATMRFQGDLYRYALADALVNRELAAAPVPALDGVAPLEQQPLRDKPEPLASDASKSSRRKYEKAMDDYREALSNQFLARYGECVVRLDASTAKALLLTAPDSAEEAASFGRLRTALATCLPEGETLRFGKVALRGSIAINYFRLAHAARAAATAR